MTKHLITRVCIAVALMNEINGLNRAREAQGALVRAGTSAFSSLCFSTTNPTDSLPPALFNGERRQREGQSEKVAQLLRAACGRGPGLEQAPSTQAARGMRKQTRIHKELHAFFCYACRRLHSSNRLR